eukprot:CAMPEP_0202706600 /NCGR_PEP_ID=MMETSP1385-20130828/18994_1 /ASSEMBLY_ACC=CAM_ASM_000861 /TAXON_ID=933848 /ORGANISM="Elphidium margaritaceum" /LENGTH=577 /DNA_ID=CAMNT_0049365111 /DNA_START=104 /DNA_END=1837 /DNA_ORIENTATION=+
MRKPGTKMLLTQMNGTRNIAVVVSFDEQRNEVAIKYERNEFMSQELLDRLRDDEFALDLSEYEHQWIDATQDLYCWACHGMDLDHLFICNHASHQPHQVAFHDRCLDAHLGHTIPSNDCARSWICPMHSSALQKVDPSKLRKRRGDYDFEFDRPQKKRRITVDPDWLKLDEDREVVYPLHLCCRRCFAQDIASQCDGHRPCGACCRYVQHEHMDFGEEKYLTMDQRDIEYEIERKAMESCGDRACTLREFEHDAAMRAWLQIHDSALYHRYTQELRERKANAADDDDDDDEDDEDVDVATSNVQKRDTLLSQHEAQELVQTTLPFKQPQFVDHVPVYARYECAQCHQLFSDKYRYKMHEAWAHQTVIATKQALQLDETKPSPWNILKHFQSDKPLKYACPYAGCLRGAHCAEEIEDHILRHHDITDPTKPKQEKDKDNGGGHKKNGKDKTEETTRTTTAVTVLPGIPELSDAERARIDEVWTESTRFQIDRKNRQALIKNFVSAVVCEHLDRFKNTTKRLQIEYKQNLQRLVHKTHRTEIHELPPALAQTADGQQQQPQEQAVQNDASAPKSIWEEL